MLSCWIVEYVPIREEGRESADLEDHRAVPADRSFNLNFAVLYDQIAAQRVRPTSLYASDDDARQVTEQLITDAGYEPFRLGGLDKARAVEDLLWLPGAAGHGSPIFYRFAAPG